MKVKSIIILGIILMSSCISLSQNGKIKGVILDDFGEALLAADISVEGTDIKTTTDLEGKFSISIVPGTYNLLVVAPFFSDNKYKDVVVKAGETTKVEVKMNDGSEEFGVLEVVAKRNEESEAATDNKRKKTNVVADIIGSEAIAKSGDKNAVAAVSRVPGVTIQEGKYVYVRGLGDRYTKTVLNGMDIPGLDPDRNAMQLDVFPTNIIKNIVIYKAFSPDLTGDFVGGLVDIQTQDFPDEFSLKLNGSLGYRPGMTFNNDYISYETSKLDAIGFGARDRAIPFPGQIKIPSRTENNESLSTITGLFSKNMATQNASNFLNSNFGISGGNSFTSDSNRVTFGFNGALSYSNKYTYYEKATYARYTKDTDEGTNDLFEQERIEGKLGVRNVLWTGLLSGGLRFNNPKAKRLDNHSYNLTVLHTQNGQSQAADRKRKNLDQTGATLVEDILTYTQRAVSNATLISKWDMSTLEIESKNSFTYSKIQDPDYRTTALSVSDGDTTLKLGDGAQISRFWRDLNETNFNSQLNLTKTITFRDTLETKIKFGGAFSQKSREFNTYQFNFQTTLGYEVEGDPDYFFEDENIWVPDSPTESDNGVYAIGNYEPTNNYLASQNIISAYLMNELPVSAKLKAVYGARMELTKMFYTGQNNSGTERYFNDETLNEMSILPSVNLVYALKQTDSTLMNLRVSGNKTLARPSFKEKSIAEIFDPITQRTFVGNIDLAQTNVWNFDARWEFFFKPGEIISVSGFYKQFDGHIELVSFQSAPDNLKPQNAGSSSILGAEFEARKKIGFISTDSSSWALSGNFTFVQSKLDMTEIIVAENGTNEFESRMANARSGEVVSQYRSMTGQAPYNVNVGLNYSNEKNGISGNLSYNIQGKTLAVVGVGSVPDIFVSPFHSLNLKLSKEISDVVSVTFKIKNIMNDNREQLYSSYSGATGIFSDLTPGRTFSISASLNLAKLKAKK